MYSILFPLAPVVILYCILCKAIERALLAKPDEPPAPITVADVYLQTRKRKPGREYKLPAAEITKKIVSCHLGLFHRFFSKLEN